MERVKAKELGDEYKLLHSRTNLGMSENNGQLKFKESNSKCEEKLEWNLKY